MNASVDTHAHIYHAGMSLAGDAWHRPTGEAPLAVYVACLDRCRIRRAVLAAASLFDDTNDYALEVTASNPRLKTTVIVDPLTEISRLRNMADRGAVGIRLQWRSTPEPPDLRSTEWRRLFRHASDLGWHVQLHDNGPRLPNAIAAIEESRLPLVIDHFGRPDRLRGVNCDGFKAVLRAVERGNTWVKLSAPFRVGPRPLIEQLVNALLHHAGPERLFWGSDWPFVGFEGEVTYEQVVADFHSLVPDPKVRGRIHAAANSFYFG